MIQPSTVEDESPWKRFGQMMTHKAVHLLSLFLMVYIGVEVTIGGIYNSLQYYRSGFNGRKNHRMDGIVLDAYSWRWT